MKLTSKFFAAVIITVLFVIVVFIFSYQFFIVPWHKEMLTTKAFNVADCISYSSRYADEKEMNNLIKDMISILDGISYIVILDKNGKALLHSNPGRVGMFFNDQGTQDVLLSGKKHSSIYYRDINNPESPYHMEKVVGVMVPFFNNENRNIGAVSLGVSDKAASEVRTKYFLVFLSITLFILFTALYLFFRIYRFILKPLNIVSLIAEEKGELFLIKSHPSFNRHDELGLMLRSFYEMNLKNKDLINDLMESKNRLSNALETSLQSEKNFKYLFDSINDAVIIHELDGKPIAVNKRMLEMYEVSEPEALSFTVKDYTSESGEHENKAKEFWRFAVNEGETFMFEWPARKPLSGQPFPVRVFMRKILWFGQESVMAIVTDIADEKKHEKEISEINQKYRYLFESMRDAIAFSDMKGNIIDFNNSFTNMTGYSPEELKSMKFKDITPAKWHEKEHDIMISQVKERHYSDIYEKEYIRRDGKIIPVEIRLYFYQINDEGEQIRMGIARDISERKKWENEIQKMNQELEEKVKIRTRELEREIEARKLSEDALVESEGKFRTLSEKSMVGVAILQDNIIVYANPALCDMLGLSPVELIFSNGEKFINPEELIAVEEKVQKIISGELTTAFFEFEGIKKNGGKIYMETYASSFLFKSKPAVMTSIIDVTMKKEFEREILKANIDLEILSRELEEKVKSEVAKRISQEQIMMQQSKQAAMGEMIGAIAHQWRQPLNAVSFILQNVKDAFEFNELTKEKIEDSYEKAIFQIKFMSKTIDDFRNFFRPEKEPEVFDVAEIIGDVVALIDMQFKNSGVKILLNEKIIGCTVKGFRNELKQVFLNILYNSRDVLKNRENGWLKIGLSCGINDTFIFFEDNGGGISEEAASRIFEPYFTTKEDGTGIGLYMCKRIIENSMKGSISFENTAEGVRFIINLPRME